MMNDIAIMIFEQLILTMIIVVIISFAYLLFFDLDEEE